MIEMCIHSTALSFLFGQGFIRMNIKSCKYFNIEHNQPTYIFTIRKLRMKIENRNHYQ